MDLYSNLKQIANARGMNLQDVASKAGLGINSLYKWKRQTPGADTLKKVAEALNVSLDELTGIVSIKKPHNNSVDDALGTIMSFDGKPVTDHDRKVMKSLLESYLKNKQ